jgi:hypothetical protein
MWCSSFDRADDHVSKTILVENLLASTHVTVNNGCQEHISTYPPSFESSQPFVNSPLVYYYHQAQFFKCYWLPNTNNKSQITDCCTSFVHSVNGAAIICMPQNCHCSKYNVNPVGANEGMFILFLFYMPVSSKL